MDYFLIRAGLGEANKENKKRKRGEKNLPATV